MKKLYLLLLSFICLCSLNAFAEHNYLHQKQQMQNNCVKPCPKKQTSCPQTMQRPRSECFLCTEKNMCTLFSQMRLSNTQICTAQKIQDKYDLEVYSLNDRIKCEEESLCRMEANCCKASEIRKQKRLIKKLKKERKKICKCYEEQFKSILSSDQKRSYRKYKKCN
ncbi:MAG: hypothetical protein IJY61_03940 [Candidatus Gastranaerophilales bacterium]|nr:hypothetical protein [Candidatus Gastranaerophilales bacterium]